MNPSAVYIPMDRLQALANGQDLPERTRGSGLFADISGFTALTAALVQMYGPQRGAEELTHHLNLVYDALIDELHRYGGSVISFSGDAITCWFDGDADLRATACALAMQQAMRSFAAIPLTAEQSVSLAMKAAVATGTVRRFVVGDPQIQLVDVMAGFVLDLLASGEHQARKGEVILAPATAAALGERVQITGWRHDDETDLSFAVIDRLNVEVAPAPWPPLAPDALPEAQLRPWLLPLVYERLHSGQGEFLAELRPATALFLRFGGIDYDGDADARQKINTFITEAQRILTRYEASLLQVTIGDKGSYLYAAFGAPVAHEDDAARAASAALEMHRLRETLQYLGKLQIGISQGRMRTGAYGGSERRTYGVLGNEVNMAARLMQNAAGGQTLVSEYAWRAAGERFVWQSLPPLTVKGRTEPLTVFALLGGRTRRAGQLQAPVYHLPMVGREAELSLLTDRLTQALAGQGQIVGVTGEAGMGKTRLVAEVLRAAELRGMPIYGGECESYGTNNSYLVWHNVWRGLFGVDQEWAIEQQIAALELRLNRINPLLVPRLPLLGSLLNIPIPDNDLTESFDARLRKTALESLLVDCLRAYAAEAPLLLVLEDCQWLDALSHDLLEELARVSAQLPVLLIVLYRPLELQHLQAPRIIALPHYSEVRLTEFRPAEAERLIMLKLRQLTGDSSELPAALVERITARAQGNPFYIEELLNYLRDRGIDPHDLPAIEQLDLPTSLQSLILSRIDQLGESEKSTLKVASVIGRIFRATMLWGVYPQLGVAERVVSNLETLNRMELTVLEEPEPELVYLFKHVVTQQVAYESLPFATRALLHEQVGQYIERTANEQITQVLDLLAYHFDRSQNLLKRREYLLLAGRVAQKEFALLAALDYYERVVALLDPIEQPAVLENIGRVLVWLGRYSEAAARYAQALELAMQYEDRQRQARLQLLTGELEWRQSRYSEAAQWIEQARSVYEQAGDREGLAESYNLAGILADYQGHFAIAVQLYEQGLALQRELNELPGVANTLGNLGSVARVQGDYQRARALQEECLATWRQSGNKHGMAMALSNLGNVLLDLGEIAIARASLEEALSLMRLIGDKWMLGNILNNLGNVLRTQKEHAGARMLYRESLTIYADLGDKWALSYLLEDLGALNALEQRHEVALKLVGAAAALRDEIGAPLSQVEREKLEQLLAGARGEFETEQQLTLEGSGRSMTLREAIELAMAP